MKMFLRNYILYFNNIVTFYISLYFLSAVKACDTDIRLVEGGNSHTGRIELYYNGSWSTMCNKGWNLKSASVACKMAGFENGAKTWRTFGEGSGKILMSDVRCTGSESCLSQCAYSEKTHTCAHANDVGVVCYEDSSDQLNINAHTFLRAIFGLFIMLVVCFSFLFKRQRHLQNRQDNYISIVDTLKSILPCFTLCKKQSDSSPDAASPPSGNQSMQGTASVIQVDMFESNQNSQRTVEEETGRRTPPPSYESVRYDTDGLHGFPNFAYEHDVDPNLPPPPAYETVINKPVAQSEDIKDSST